MKFKPGAKVEFKTYFGESYKGVIVERCDVHKTSYYIKELKSDGEYYIHEKNVKLINSFKHKLK